MSGSAETEPSGGQTIFWLVYGQIAAMLGAFSLLVFLTHFFELGLKGVVRDAFDGWVQYVRPVVGYPLQWIVAQLPAEWHLIVPAQVKDYFAVAIASGFSRVRAMRGRDVVFNDTGLPAQAFDILLASLLWPVSAFVILRGLWGILTNEAGAAVASLTTMLWLAPLIYLGLLFAANAWLPA